MVAVSTLPMNDSYEGDIGALLTELADVQSALLTLLGEKRTLLVSGNVDALAAIGPREQDCKHVTSIGSSY